MANHEHIIALKPFYKGFIGTTLRYDYELCPQVCRLSAACERMQTTILARSAALPSEAGMSGQSLAHISNDITPELMIDGEFRVPAPLDRRIASVWLRANTNNPTEGYDISLSASFGKERVVLKADDFEIEADVSITSADIELSFVGCFATQLDTVEGKRSAGWTTTRVEQSVSGAASRADAAVQGRFGADATGTLQAGVAASSSMSANQRHDTQSVVRQEMAHGDWHLLSSNAVKVGLSGNALEGQIIGDYKGWRVTPMKTDQTSGVFARVRVREDWITFENVQHVRAPSALLRTLREMFQVTEDKQRRRRRELFVILLRHLAQTELRGQQTEREATIAMHGVVVRPAHEHVFSATSDSGRREICIPSHPIAQFLDAEPGEEEGALIALGVSKDIIPPSGRKKRGGTFVPESSPSGAVDLLRTIQQKHPQSVIYGGPGQRLPNELRDLRALNLVGYENGEVRLLASPDIPAESLMRRAVSEMESIRVARGVLRINPAASAKDIADAVAMELQRPWSKDATRQRNGGAIKRWMLWLEPHLIDPTTSGQAAALVNYATSSAAIKGRPGVLTPETEQVVRQLFDERVPVSIIADRFKVTRNGVYNWMRKLGVDPRTYRRGKRG